MNKNVVASSGSTINASLFAILSWEQRFVCGALRRDYESKCDVCAKKLITTVTSLALSNVLKKKNNRSAKPQSINTERAKGRRAGPRINFAALDILFV